MQKGVLKIYGEIWEYGINSAKAFIADLSEMERKGLDVINLHCHCKGGDVLEGVAIYNAIKACKTPVDLYVDGVCASMMTIIMLACRHIYMADNAFLMIHAPSGGAYGTAKEIAKVAKLLKSMEKNFLTAYSARTGKTEIEVSNWLDGDNWFSAPEALSEKLITGIVGAVDASSITLTPDERKITTANMLYNRFTALINNKSINNLNTKKSMDKQKMIDLYGLTTVTAESSDEAVMEAISAKLKASETAKINAENALRLEKEAQVTALVTSAVASRKITEAQKASFVAIGTNAGIEALQMALDAIKPIGSITGMLASGGDGSQSMVGREAWTWDDYQAKDVKALEQLKQKDNARFMALYNAKYKK